MLQSRPSTTQRAQGRPGADRTHGPRAKKMHGAGTTGTSRINPAFPARWLYGLYVIFPVTMAWLPPSPAATRWHRSRLERLLRSAQNHTTSPSASATFVRRACRGHRIPAPRFVTIGRNAPLHRGGMAWSIVVICPTRQARGCAADWHDGQLAHGWRAGIARRAGEKRPQCMRRLIPVGGFNQSEELEIR
jgi:hypothetical protein